MFSWVSKWVVVPHPACIEPGHMSLLQTEKKYNLNFFADSIRVAMVEFLTVIDSVMFLTDGAPSRAITIRVILFKGKLPLSPADTQTREDQVVSRRPPTQVCSSPLTPTQRALIPMGSLAGLNI